MKDTMCCFAILSLLFLCGCSFKLENALSTSASQAQYPTPERVSTSTSTSASTPDPSPTVTATPVLTEQPALGVALFTNIVIDDLPYFHSSLFWREAIKCIDILNECYAETFTAMAQNNTPYYYAGYTSEEAFWTDVRNPCILFSSEQSTEYSDEYFIDWLQIDYRFVSNYQTAQQVNDYLLNYVSQEIIDDARFASAFLEYEDNLYFRRESRGYGMVQVDIESLRFIKYENNQYYLTINSMVDGTVYGEVSLTFEYANGRLILMELEENPSI